MISSNSLFYSINSQILSRLGRIVLDNTNRENINNFEQLADQVLEIIRHHQVTNSTTFMIDKIVKYRLKYRLKLKLERLSPIYRTEAYQKYAQHAKPMMVLNMSELDQLLEMLMIRPNRYINRCLLNGILMKVPLDHQINQVTSEPYFFLCPNNWCSSCQKFESSDASEICGNCRLPLSNMVCDKPNHHRLETNFIQFSNYNKKKTPKNLPIKYTLICYSSNYGEDDEGIKCPAELSEYVYPNFNPVKVLQKKLQNQEGRSTWEQRQQVLIQAGIIPQLILDKIAKYGYYGQALHSYLQELKIIN